MSSPAECGPDRSSRRQPTTASRNSSRPDQPASNTAIRVHPFSLVDALEGTVLRIVDNQTTALGTFQRRFGTFQTSQNVPAPSSLLRVVGKGDAVSRLVGTCPDFKDAWRAHLDYWNGEPAGEYIDLGALAQWVVDRMDSNDAGCFPALFKELEELLAPAGAELRDLLVVGLLEDIQNVSANRKVNPDLVLPYLGPESRKGWFELIRSWHGPGGAGWPGQKNEY